VIRDNEEYYAIKNYIINNPRNWHMDQFRRDLPPANPRMGCFLIGHAIGMSLQEF